MIDIKNIKYGALYTENDNLRSYLPRYYECLNDQNIICGYLLE